MRPALTLPAMIVGFLNSSQSTLSVLTRTRRLSLLTCEHNRQISSLIFSRKGHAVTHVWFLLYIQRREHARQNKVSAPTTWGMTRLSCTRLVLCNRLVSRIRSPKSMFCTRQYAKVAPYLLCKLWAFSQPKRFYNLARVIRGWLGLRLISVDPVLYRHLRHGRSDQRPRPEGQKEPFGCSLRNKLLAM